MLQLSQFAWPLSYSVWDVFNNFLLTDATDRSKISSDKKKFFDALSLCLFHFSRTLPLITFIDLKCTLKTQNILKESNKKKIAGIYKCAKNIFIIKKDLDQESFL